MRFVHYFSYDFHVHYPILSWHFYRLGSIFSCNFHESLSKCCSAFFSRGFHAAVGMYLFLKLADHHVIFMLQFIRSTSESGGRRLLSPEHLVIHGICRGFHSCISLDLSTIYCDNFCGC